jgi:YesN/AraC family two-component response regulator
MRILIVEDEMITSRDLQQIVAELGHEVVGAATGAARALEIARLTDPDLALVDVRLEGSSDGLTLAQHLREELGTAVIFISAFTDADTLARAKAARPASYIVKPFLPTAVHAAITMAAGPTPASASAADPPADGSVAPLSASLLTKVTSYIARHLSTGVTLAQLAEIADMSEFHFAKRFRVSTGLPPHQYVIRQRVDEAKRLLRATDWPVARIAENVGYGQQAHFTQVFRRLEGLTPSDYRRRVGPLPMDESRS